MVHAIRAVYQNGQLRLLDPVDLVEGQEIQMMILPDKEQVDTADVNESDVISPNDPLWAEVDKALAEIWAELDSIDLEEEARRFEEMRLGDIERFEALYGELEDGE